MSIIVELKNSLGRGCLYTCKVPTVLSMKTTAMVTGKQKSPGRSRLLKRANDRTHNEVQAESDSVTERDGRR